MTKRMEGGEGLGAHEVPLYVLLLRSRSPQGPQYKEIFADVVARLSAIEGKLQTEASLRTVTQGARRVPQPNLGPPNQTPFDV